MVLRVFRIIRYFLMGALLVPLGLVLLWVIFTYLPPAAAFLNSTLGTMVGQIPIFSQASEILQSTIKLSKFSMSEYLLWLPVLLFSALGDSLTIACCIFCVKSVFTRFNRRWQGRFTKPMWLMVAIGVVVGVSICTIRDQLMADFQALFTLIVCLACVLSGLGLMMRGLNFSRGGTYHNRWAGFLIRMMLGIISDLLDALCGVFIATAVIQGHRLVSGGGNAWVCILWILVSALLIFAKNALLDAAQPQNV